MAKADHNSPIAVRYAKALLQLGNERQTAEQIRGDLVALCDDGTNVGSQAANPPSIPAGTYTIRAVDDAFTHNFHLAGPGVATAPEPAQAPAEPEAPRTRTPRPRGSR